jgi:hypothetical protein
MILHICEDNRFVAMAKKQFEICKENQHLFLVNSSSKGLKYITKDNSIIVEKAGTKKHSEVVNQYLYDAIIFHNCNQKYKWNIINNLPKNILIIWFSWGSDIYMLPQFKNKLYTEKTTQILKKNNLTYNNYSLDYFSRLLLGKYKKQLSAYKRINYCAPVMSKDLNLLEQHYNIKIKELDFTYGDINLYIGESIDKNSEGNNILVGNSADFSNNHIDILNTLKNKNIGNSKIIVPLSYGGHKKYINHIVSQGKLMFRDKFTPLLEVLLLIEYREILYSCKIAIFNHKRQQALGNIIMLLWMGVKLFLDEENPIYSFLKDNNIIVYKISQIETFSEEEFLIKLTDNEVNNNRMQLSKIYSHERVIDKSKEIVKLIALMKTQAC